ncbi:MAG: hypothetical protein WDA17_00800 [Sphaerochaetaceae bacterium]
MGEEITKICPNSECRYHNPEFASKKRWYRPHGYYYCPTNPDKPIRRYRCSTCGRTFSETYFSRKWHLQRTDIDEVDLFFEWCKGSSLSDLANRFSCSKKLIENRITRMKNLAESKEIILEIESPEEKVQLRL